MYLEKMPQCLVIVDQVHTYVHLASKHLSYCGPIRIPAEFVTMLHFVTMDILDRISAIYHKQHDGQMMSVKMVADISESMRQCHRSMDCSRPDYDMRLMCTKLRLYMEDHGVVLASDRKARNRMLKTLGKSCSDILCPMIYGCVQNAIHAMETTNTRIQQVVVTPSQKAKRTLTCLYMHVPYVRDIWKTYTLLKSPSCDILTDIETRRQEADSAADAAGQVATPTRAQMHHVVYAREYINTYFAWKTAVYK